MQEERGFFIELAELVERHRRKPRARKRAPARVRRCPDLLRWLTPNGGTLILIALLIATQSIWAQPFAATSAPGPSAATVNYQGRLADSGGSPLDGAYDMRFAIYDAEKDGDLVWGPEFHSAVPVSDGLFSVGLGSLADGIPTSVWSGDRYLEITVRGETLSPRELIRSVPIAGVAMSIADGSVTTEKIADGSVTTSKLSLDSTLNLNGNPIRHALAWPVSYDGRGSSTALPGFNDTLYYGVQRDIVVESNRQAVGGAPALAAMFDLKNQNPATWNDVGPTNPVVITIGYPGKGPLISGVSVTFGWRARNAVDYSIQYYADPEDDGAYSWRTIANVVGNNQYEIYHPVSSWRVQRIRMTVTKAGAADQVGMLSISTIQGLSGTHGKATGHMLDIGGDTMYGNLNMNGNSIVNQGAMVEANLQTPEELAAERIDRFSEGDVLCWGEERLELCAQHGDRLVQAVADDSGRPIVIGAEVIKVVGPVYRGDLLVASDVPGYAIAAANPGPGTVIAQALAEFHGARGVVKAMIRKF